MRPLSAVRIYRGLLRLLPRAFRREAEADMLDVFTAAYARVAARRWPVRGRFWAGLLADLTVTVLAERAAALPRETSGRSGRPRMDLARLVTTMAADVRVAIRQLLKTPGWTTIASGTLALGLAATMVAATLLRDVVLASLPIPGADRLVRILEVSDNGRQWWPSFPNAQDWRAHGGRTFDAVAIVGTPRPLPVLLETEAVRATVAGAGAAMFETLGVSPIAGRLFAPDEHTAGARAVAIVSERFWRGPLRARPLDGVTVTIDDEVFAVVGVLPASFKVLGEAAAWEPGADVWQALERRPALLGRRTSHGTCHVIARLGASVTLERARAEANELAAALAAHHREPTQAHRLLLTPLQDVVVRRAREPLRLLLWAGVAVLLVSLANLAAAILAQGLTRVRELHIRSALGATRGRLIAHLVAGSAVLALPGTAIGFVLAAAGLTVLRTYAAATWPRLDEVSLDAASLAVQFAAAAAVAMTAALIPAVLLSARATREQLTTRDPGGNRREPWIWRVLVAAQVAVTVTLLAGAGLLVRSFVRAVQVELGYDPTRVLAVDVTLPLGRYPTDATRAAFFDAALARLGALPGAERVGLTSVLPHETTAYIAGTSLEGAADTRPGLLAGYRVVDSGYFEAMGIPRVYGSGRALEQGSALIDRRLMQLLLGGAPPDGARLRNSFAREVLSVAGVVGTVREWYQGDDTIGAVYVHYRRHPLSSMHLVIRHDGRRATALAAAARRALAEIDPLVPTAVAPFGARVAEAMRGPRLFLVIALGFGGATLLLAAAGIYALVAFVAGRQLREAAIRLALGARPDMLRRRIVAQGVRPALVGIAVGLLLVPMLLATLRSQLFETSGADPLALGGAAAVILVAAVAASIAPARRSSRVDPAVALRQE